MADERAARHVPKGRRTGLVVLGALALVFPVVLTSAAWVDQAHVSGVAAGSTFDLQARFAFNANWEDIGLPGSPDTFDDGFEVEVPPIFDVLPGHSYVGDVFLCNAGDIDGRISNASLEEITTTKEGMPGVDLQLVEPESIRVENIDINTIIPANSCTASTEPNPPNDVEGVIHFTTVPDFTGQYGSTSRIVIKFWVTSVPVIGAADGGGGQVFAPTSAAWEDRGAASMSVTAIQEPPPPLTSPVLPDVGTSFGSPTWSGIGNDPNPTPTSACFRIEIFTTSPDPAPWRVILETDQPPFNNVPPFTSAGFQGRLSTDDRPGYTFEPAADYSISGRYLMDPTSPTQYASQTQSHIARVCMDRVPEPEWQPPGSLSYSQLPELPLIRKGSTPCVVATVEGHEPYYVGFSISFNWKDYLDERLAADEITQAEYDSWLPYTHWSSGPPGYDNARGATGTDYLVTFQGLKEESRNISAISPVTLGSCAS
jgi:hypothetical protein